MLRNVLFLDIDGVLNSEDWFTRTANGKGMFDPKCVELLNYITDNSNTDIVLSSSWRMDENVNNILYNHGITGNIIDKTSRLALEIDYLCRGNEIQKWLLENEYNNYVILDDDSDMLVSQLDNFVHIDYKVGLSEENVKSILKILNE